MPRHGSTLESFLKEEGIYEEVHAAAVKSLLAYQIAAEMERRDITKTAMAQRMNTSRSQLDRLLDPKNTAVSLDTLFSAARAVGRTLQVTLGDLPTVLARTPRPALVAAKNVRAGKVVQVAKRSAKRGTAR